MAAGQDIQVRIRLSADGTRGVVSDVQRVERGFQSASERAAAFGRSMAGLRTIAAGLAGAFGGIAVGGFLRDVVNETEQAARNLLRTEALLKATGSAVGFNAEQLKAQASGLALATLQSVEGVEQAQQVMLTFKSVTGDTFTEALSLAADMASVFGGDLSSSATQLGKALEDPVAGLTALRRVGVTFSEDQQALIKSLVEAGDAAAAQGVILEALAGQLGGVAKAEAMGLAGAMDTLAQRVQEAKIAIGEASGITDTLADIYNTAAEAVHGFAQSLNAGQLAADFAAWADVLDDVGRSAEIVKAALAGWETDNGSNALDNWGAAAYAFGESIAFVGEAILELPDNVRKMAYVVAAEVENLASRWDVVWDAIVATAAGVWAEITRLIGTALANIQQAVSQAVQWIADRLASLTGEMASFADKASNLPGVGEWASSLSAGLGELEQRFSSAADAAFDHQVALEGTKVALEANANAARANLDAAKDAIAADVAAAQQRRELAVEMIADLDRQRLAEQAVADARREYLDDGDEIFAQMDAFNGVTNEAAASAKTLAENSEDAAGGLDRVVKSGGGAAKGVKAVADESVRAAKALADQAKGIDSLIDKYLPLRAAAEDYAEAQQTVAAALAIGTINAAEATTILDGLGAEYAQATDEAETFASEWSEIWDSAAQALDSAWSGMWDNIVNGTGDTLDQLKKSIKSWLADLAAMLSKQLVVNVVANITGTGGLTGGIGQMASNAVGNLFGGGGGSILGGFGSALSSITSGAVFSGLSTGFGLAAANIGAAGYFGAFAPTMAAAGSSFASGAIGTGIGLAAPYLLPALGIVGLLAGSSLFGDKKPDPGAYSTSFNGTAGLEDGVGVQGAFGLTFGMSDKGGKNIDAQEWRPAFEGMASVSQMLANFYGPELQGQIQESLEAAAAQGWDMDGIMRFSGDFDTAFDKIFTDILNHAEATGDEAAAALKYAIGDLWGPAEHMTMQLEGGIVAVTAAAQMMDTELGDALGFTQGLPDASKQIYEWGLMTLQSGETIAQSVARVVAELGLFDQAMQLTGASIAELDVDTIREASAALVEAAGGLEQLAAMQSYYYQNFYTEEERAAKIREQAQAQVDSFNESLGLTGDAAIDTREEFRAYIESLDLTTEAGRAAYIEAMKYAEAIVYLDQTMANAAQSVEDLTQATIDGFVDSIKPESAKEEEAFNEMQAIFAGWGMQIPRTSEALYELIQAGAFTDAQLLILAEHSEELGLAWAYLAREQAEAFAEMEAAAQEAIAAAREASAARIAALREESAAIIAAAREASAARIAALNAAYQAQVDAINKQIAEARDLVSEFRAVVDAAASALRSLRQQADGIDETRQRTLEEAREAIEEFRKTGKLPDDITDIIAGLGSVDANDFASREEWLAAIAENEAMIKELEAIGAGQVTEGEAQIAALEAQLEQAKALHEAALAAERENLAALIKAEEENLQKAIEAEEEALQGVIDGINAQLELDKAAYLEQWEENNGLQARQLSTLEAILVGISTGDWSALNTGERPDDGEAGNPVPIQEIINGILTAITKDTGTPPPGADPTDPAYTEDGSVEQATLSVRDLVSELLTAQREGDAYAADQRIRWADAQADWHRAEVAATEALERAAVQSLRESTFDMLAASRDSDRLAERNHIDLTDSLREQTADLLSGLADVESAVRAVGSGGETEQSLQIPGFASGGFHSGGLRLVGERGPELEYTGPSFVSPHDSMAGIMREGNVDVVDEIRRLRGEIRDLQAIQRGAAINIAAQSKTIKRWDGEGLPADRMDYQKSTATNTAP